ncbi:FAD dependent oxidoreductase [Wolfiporia cocos MD-104 SS10]|uniref:FAD dependent oxidoreductase n=1 Tax=Wolfiporia cocos (strain MD-104) TaxID=742152 RepID=A0A2H3IZQ3_WOLCO|nr:FAD dependent oxidoreductase [Wolfiporia cocos MD-104 SS10]
MGRLAIATALLALFKPAFVVAQLTNYTSTCISIASAISSASNVYYPYDVNYLSDISHYASSSAQNSTCSVEPGTAEDVATILQIVGRTKTPFGVKGGGHIMNPGYSSTPGVLISMTRFNSVVYDSSAQTAAVGAGLTWDSVYSALEPHGVNVVGGRVSGIGVAGYTLGGGYSWLTNQYGLSLDNVAAFELVLPNGTIINVTESSYPDLYFGLRGGYNNYGIVTTFTLRTYPQGQVWGGQLIFLGTDVVDQVNTATANFAANVTDPKASIITTVDFEGGVILASVLIFYDAPEPPSGIFDEFLAIPAFSSNVSTRSFLDLIQVEPTETSTGYRGYYNTVPLQEITPSILQLIVEQAQYWGSILSGDTENLISYDIEPLLPTILDHGSPSAYPPTRAQRFLPLNIYFSWTDASYDSDFYNAIVASQENITLAAMQEGQSEVGTAPRYPNYAIYNTPISYLYGNSLSTMSQLKARYDPDNVMGLAGGWKIY